MSKKSKGLIVAAAAFASSPQGRRLLQQAKEYATRPETKQRAQELLSSTVSRGKGGTAPSSTVTPAVSTDASPTPGTPASP